MANSKIKVGVIMGGPSSEHEVSLASGENVLKNLDSQLFESVKIKILRDGKVWMAGRYAKLEKAVKGVDLCLLATHGEFGEDGRLQAVLESYGVPYTGSGVLASALAMNKAKSRQLFSMNGLKTPKTLIVREDENFKSQLNFFVNKLAKMPLVVKPCSRGSSVGVSIVKNKRLLSNAIRQAFKYDPEVLVEEHLSGREFTCGIIERLNGTKKEIRALPITEIVTGSDHEFYNYDAKYKSEETKLITPALISENLSREIQDIAVKAHQVLSCKDYSRVDFRLKNGKPHILELNTLPGLTSHSLIPKQLGAAGVSFEEFLSELCIINYGQVNLG